MQGKVNSLLDNSVSETNQTNTNAQSKLKAIESIADTAVETELTTKNMPETKAEETKKEVTKKVKPGDNSKMWTIAVVVSALILLASAAGMVFILLTG